MQNASQAYRNAMEKTMLRNRAYIKVSIGIVNQLAQESAAVDTSGLYYFASGDIFSGQNLTQMYATAEKDYSKVDGSMYFAPESGSGAAYYNQGAVSNALSGNIRISFGSVTDLDIKGFTIDFGDCYPTRFTLTTDAGAKTYTNESRYFSTEDTFDGTSYVLITPLTMVNGQGRLRILSFTCGIANTFSNNEVIDYSSKEYVSPISDSLPSMDMSISIDNQDQYYNPDNPASALAYMEVGQEMTVQFGYDIPALVRNSDTTNILPITYNDGIPKYYEGLTFVVNRDGSVTISGTNTSAYNYRFNLSDYPSGVYMIPSGRYILSGCPSGSSYSTYYMQYTLSTGTQTMSGYVTTTSGTTINVTRNDFYISSVGIVVCSGCTFTEPVTFYPMLRSADITDDTYVPYYGEGYSTEWLPSQIAHLKTWSATDTDAKFTAVDKFDYLLNANYIKGQIYTYGITLYNLAVAVLNDAGITDPSEYYIDEYLKKVVVYNPLPIAKHSECLQIIANAGRCCLYIDRDDRIHIAGNFMPDATATTTTGETAYSHVGAIVNGEEKEGYANASQDFSIVNGTLHFLPSDNSYLTTGFISSQVADASGSFLIQPTIEITLETEFVYYGLGIYFRNTAPKQFTLYFYNNGSIVNTKYVTDNEGLVWTTNEQSVSFNKLRIVFTKGYPNSRVFVDNIKFGDSTDYTISRNYSLTTTPTATRQNRIQSISVARHTYSNSTEAIKSLKSETITIPIGSYFYKNVEFSNASYGYTLTVQNMSGASSYSYGISASGAHYARIYFYASGGTGTTATVQYTINGREYVISDSDTTNTYHASGDLISWNNPLVSETAMAQDIADWLGDYYNGDVTYSIPWRGDPRVDANDLFNLELKTGETALIRAYQNEFAFNGGFSGTLQARKYGGL